MTSGEVTFLTQPDGFADTDSCELRMGPGAEGIEAPPKARPVTFPQAVLDSRSGSRSASSVSVPRGARHPAYGQEARDSLG